jgi:NADPH2:quinone reductase
MRFIDIKQPGAAEVLFLNEGPAPKPKPHEVLIQVKAAGVNHSDLMQRAGKYPPPAGTSPILGLEVAGVITQVGSEVTEYEVGDAVCALTNGGGYAEYCAVPEGQCLPIPLGLDFVEAASLPEVYFTVWNNLFMRTYFHEGESVLIHGGASGIGTCAIQLVKAFGGFVITTVGTPEKVKFCKQLHADLVINYKEDDFFEVLRKRGVDFILDMVGGDYFEKNLSLLKEEGRLVEIATMHGIRASIDLRQLISKRLTILGSSLRSQSAEAKALIAQELMIDVWPLFEEKKLKPIVTKVFPFTQASEAHQWMESGKHIGKIILAME